MVNNQMRAALQRQKAKCKQLLPFSKQLLPFVFVPQLLTHTDACADCVQGACQDGSLGDVIKEFPFPVDTWTPQCQVCPPGQYANIPADLL